MNKKITSLGKTPLPRPARAASPRPAQPISPGVGGVGRLPLQTGQLILTPGERKALESQGWKDGDPLPANLARQIADVTEEAGTPRPPVPMDTPRVKVPDSVDISQLSLEKQKGVGRLPLQTGQLIL